MFEKLTQTTEHLSLQYQLMLFAKVYHSHIQYLCSVLDPKVLKAFTGSRKGHRDGGDCGISTSVDENKDRRCGPQKQSFYSLLNPESLKAHRVLLRPRNVSWCSSSLSPTLKIWGMIGNGLSRRKISGKSENASFSNAKCRIQAGTDQNYSHWLLFVHIFSFPFFFFKSEMLEWKLKM